VAIAGPLIPGWSAFGAEGPPDLRIEVALDPGCRPGAGAARGVRISRAGQSLHYQGPGGAGILDVGRGEARFATFPGGRHLDGFLRFALGVLLLERGGLLLHASAAERAGRGYAFLGPSGAGKSTIAKLARASGARVLGDEVVAVAPAGNGARIFATPFVSRGAPAGEPGEALLAAYAVLERAEAHRWEPLPAARVARALLATAILAPEAARPGRLLDTATDLAHRAPGGLLAFARDEGFWTVLAA
jgi:hypothetical protein